MGGTKFQANVSQDIDKVEKIHKNASKNKYIKPNDITRNTHTEDRWDPHNPGVSSKCATMENALVMRILERR